MPRKNDKRFYVKSLNPTCWAVMSRRNFSEDGLPLKPAIINMFITADRTAADKYCAHLNDAVDLYFKDVHSELS